MNCYQFKGGSGTASAAIVDELGQAYTVGVFVQANFGARRELVLAGVPVGGARRNSPIGLSSARSPPTGTPASTSSWRAPKLAWTNTATV